MSRMWYVKDETGQTHFKNSDVRKTQNYATLYNKTHKIPGTKILIGDFSSIFGYYPDIALWDINYKAFNKKGDFSFNRKKESPFNKNYNKQHYQYVDKKHKKLCQLGKKYHVWSYNSSGRKADSFDF